MKDHPPSDTLEDPRLDPPDPLESQLKPVHFKLEGTDPVTGFVIYEGTYTNAERQRFALKLISPRDDDDLKRYREELRVAFLAKPDDAPPRDGPTEKTARAGKSLVQLVEEGTQEVGADTPVLGLEVQCDWPPEATADRKGADVVTMFGLIHPSIAHGHRHCYHGVDRVTAAAKGDVLLGGLTNNPNPVHVPASQDRDANRACWVEGVAQSSKYQLGSKWYQVKC